MDKTKYSNSKRKLAAIAMAAVIGVGGAGSAAVAMSSPSPATDSAVVMDVDAATINYRKIATSKSVNNFTNASKYKTNDIRPSGKKFSSYTIKYTKNGSIGDKATSVYITLPSGYYVDYIVGPSCVTFGQYGSTIRIWANYPTSYTGKITVFAHKGSTYAKFDTTIKYSIN